jgi:Protein of unknown function (DUF3618)
VSVAENTADEGDRDETPDPAAPEGGDVAGRDPDEITREIEQTRAELADTIDAIAQRINPKRAASRGAEAVKAQVNTAKTKLGGEPNAWSVAAGSDGAVGEPGAAVGPAGPLGQVSSLAKRPEVAAVAAAVVLLLVIWRRRRSH